MTNTPKKYSTPSKRLFELKKELRQLKRRMDKKVRISEKRGERPHSYALYYNDDTWDTIEIITSDGIWYGIDCTTIYFPNINFKRIVYINRKLSSSTWSYKKNGVWHNTAPNYDSYDSEIGYYKSSENKKYYKYIQDKFPIKEHIYTGLD